MRLVSIVVPMRNRAGLTRRCLEAIFADPPRVGFEVVVVDDGSTPAAVETLEPILSDVQVVRRDGAGGFARACNEGAAAAAGDLLVFVNNDTVPRPGWLDALVSYGERHPEAAAVGSRLLFPNETVQHAGVVVGQDRLPRHLYAGFPAEHPAVMKSRRFQTVTAACMLVRRPAFDAVQGFDPVFRNGLEDADFCLRLGELGHEVHYCHESVLYHLESVSRVTRSSQERENFRLYRARWADRVKADDVTYYLEDGLLRLSYGAVYPLQIEAAPELAITAERDDPADRLLLARARQVAELLR